MSFLAMLSQEPLIAAFLAATVVIGLWAGRGANTVRDYAIANRAIGTGVLAMTFIATETDGYEFFELIDKIYSEGFAYILSAGIAWIIFPLLAGLFLAPKMVFFNDCYTLPAVMGNMIGRPVRIFTALATGTAGAAIITYQFEAIGDIFSVVLDVQANDAILYIGGLMTFYIFWSGIRAVTATDVLQFAVMVIGISYIASSLITRAKGLGNILQPLPPQWSWQQTSISRTILFRCVYLIFFPVQVIYPGIMQRMLMARDKRQGRYMFFSYAIFSTVFSIFLFSLIALSVYSLTKVENATQLPGKSVMHCVLTTYSTGPMRIMIVVGLLAAIMSTIDSYTSALGLTLAYDVLAPIASYSSGKQLKDKQLITAIRFITLTVGIGCTCMAWYGIQFGYLRSVYIYLCKMVLVGCLLPILGLKATYREFLASIIAYIIVLVGMVKFANISFTYKAVKAVNIDVLASIASLLAFLVTHILTHGGIMTVTRSHQSVSEQLWLPEHSEVLGSLRQWYDALCNLEVTAYLRFRRYGNAPYVVGFLLAMQYMIPQLHVAAATKAITYHLLLLKSYGVLLLVGLWLEGAWPVDKHHRFPLYYYITIAYCLPFMTTLSCLASPGSLAVAQWCLMLFMLFMLTDYVLLLHLLPTGALLALLCFRGIHGTWLPPLSMEDSTAAIYVALTAPLLLLAFGHLKEDRMFAQVRIAKALGSGIAHETRNFLTGSMGTGSNADLFLDMHPAKEVKSKEDKHPLYQVNKLVYNTITDLLENLRKGGPQTEKKVTLFNDALRHERFDIQMGQHSTKACVEQALKDFFVDSAAAAQRIATHLDDDFMVYCSAPFFSHLIYNLVRNAMQHGQARKIAITTHATTRTLSVQDNGKGIPPSRIPRIFDLFYTSDKREYTSRTGLGLALVKEIIASWKATITVQSQQGEGSYTRFEVTFPPLGQGNSM